MVGPRLPSPRPAWSSTETTTGGDYAVVILEIQFAQEGLAPAETCEMFRFRDGKVCEIKPYYYNPAAFDAAVAAKKAGNA